MIYDDLKKANMQAMKDKDTVARGVYTVLINKCMLKAVELKPQGKDLTDADTLAIINKTVKELEEELRAFKEANRSDKVEELEKQKLLLQTYLPKLMSEEEIIAVLNNLEDKSIKNVMMYFKTNYPGKADMKLVSELAKKL